MLPLPFKNAAGAALSDFKKGLESNEHKAFVQKLTDTVPRA
jgi:hypothetical protein